MRPQQYAKRLLEKHDLTGWTPVKVRGSHITVRHPNVPLQYVLSASGDPRAALNAVKDLQRLERTHGRKKSSSDG